MTITGCATTSAQTAVLDYLQAENAYTDAMLKPQQALRETLYEEMVARIPQQEHSVPYVRHGYRYQTRYEPGNEYAISVRQPQAESEHWKCLSTATSAPRTTSFTPRRAGRQPRQPAAGGGGGFPVAPPV